MGREKLSHALKKLIFSTFIVAGILINYQIIILNNESYNYIAITPECYYNTTGVAFEYHDF